MTPRFYFAHPINTYDTDLELELINRIYLYFQGGIEVVNPSDLVHQKTVETIKAAHEGREDASKKIMDYFLELVSSCQGGIGLPFSDGRIGAGVYKELLGIAKGHHPIWLITPGGELKPHKRIGSRKPLSIEETRERVYNPDKTLRSYF